MLLVVCVRLPYLPCRSDRRGWKHLSHKQTTCPHSAAAGPWWNCDTRPSETEMRAMQHLKLSTFGRALIVRDVYLYTYICEWMNKCVCYYTCGLWMCVRQSPVRTTETDIPVKPRCCSDGGCVLTTLCFPFILHVSTSACLDFQVIFWGMTQTKISS